ncbi:DUF1330 domain-containing protein [Teichococcus vastitatis]|uniref:DUF1330 domain-containing protein n=1 Tax=Teichococcus vastitatis TaxID=2307076 RepID=A0ABS9W8J8_9PROT|nr:DUF1330 domain-containing protein [Pseudoroseomonas vastitatis]MCI0755616.1 DUF1330 domain-containing protein [Pseudoroseomonas vastitatis]
MTAAETGQRTLALLASSVSDIGHQLVRVPLPEGVLQVVKEGGDTRAQQPPRWVFGVRILIYGDLREGLEGSCECDLIVIAFPARAWYGSPAYQALLPLRRCNAQGDVFLIDGIGEGHRATDILRAGQGAPDLEQAVDHGP